MLETSGGSVEGCSALLQDAGVCKARKALFARQVRAETAIADAQAKTQLLHPGVIHMLLKRGSFAAKLVLFKL